MPEQSTSLVLMIRPVRFAGNVETATSNRFQQLNAVDDAALVQRLAGEEFDGLVAGLRAAGVRVAVLDDTPEPHTPDAIFPNNWFSTHADGTLVLYPMQAVNRRLERRADLPEALAAQGLVIRRQIDLTHYEASQRFLEGTGSMVLDRVNGVAYACLSPRTHIEVLQDFAGQMNYRLVTFAATDRSGVAIYHTNVLMCVGTAFAVVCAEAIAAESRAAVLASLADSGRQIVTITHAQMQQFAGNLLELKGRAGPVLALSQSAWSAFSEAQRAELSLAVTHCVVAPIPTIERLGGGSVRCMLAEIFAGHVDC